MVQKKKPSSQGVHKTEQRDKVGWTAQKQQRALEATKQEGQ
jgi:hypothetical protein